jgi:anti-sigma factor (TIGR02949 family)
MRFVDVGNADCKKALALLDAYLSNELTAETTGHISAHLERCGGCGEKLRFRGNMKWRLQAAVLRDPMPAGVRRRILQRLRQTRRFRMPPLFP